ncbi:hypothetical protein N7474_011034 [Penicillium riverlandense]|uniref:uncharacterized protein n=1 Tax=Penicillium riverlandense TaxID=1903569 RepID=UPI002548F631|nr:uncharacterized protein N7474_011034 [Penicillium riverlandense]KAJ5805147.1 hypothetical protein N7474_011034 [Penicillium riverlandense]
MARHSERWSEQPCQQISHLSQSNITTFPGDVAYQCLLSIPFQAQRSIAFIEDLRKYMQWQSTIDTLKNPPTAYLSLSPATDILGGLDDLLEKAAHTHFTSQFEFDTAVTNLLKTAEDGHLYMIPCSAGIFEFSIDFPIVSISSDGLELPKIYGMSDSALLSTHRDSVSDIVSINGQPAEEFFIQYGLKIGGFQDPDARWNNIFNSNVRGGGYYSAGSWESPGVWPGAWEFKLRFANGTVHYVQTVVKGGSSFNFTNGQALYQKECIDPLIQEAHSTLPVRSSTLTPYTSYPSSWTPTPTALASSSLSHSGPTSVSPTSSASASQVYPQPVVSNTAGGVNGYYLHDKDLRNVAILSVIDFETFGDPARSIIQFLQDAKSAAKEKIIIDLSSNSGGTITSALDMFKIFFPDKPAYSATRFRAHEAIDLIGQALGAINHNNTHGFSYYHFEQFMPSGYVTPNQKENFSSWKQVFGPVYELGTNMSTLHAVFNETYESTPSYPINGYDGIPVEPKTPLFSPKDILIMTNGECSSSCTVFAEMMRSLAGVKTLAFGGRPQHASMQAIGGVKGGEEMESSTIRNLYNKANDLAEAAAKDGKPILSEMQRLRLKELTPAAVPPLYYSGSVNYLNNYRRQQQHIPLQFIYEPADCRLFYTYENYAHPATSWASAARAMWGNNRCVAVS